MPVIPQENTLDGSLGLLLDGNLYITRRCDNFESDIFQTRLLLRTTYCIRGEEAARVFYTQGRLTRRGAIPPTVLKLLQDKGSVATLDDKAHHWRKQMMMSLMTPERIQQLVDLVEERWCHRLSVWQAMEDVDLFDEVQHILCGAVCEWCGIAVSDRDLDERTREIAAMIDGAGAVGWRNWRGILLRRRTEKWIEGKINAVRTLTFGLDQPSPLQVIATHLDDGGNRLSSEVAAIEMLNLIRPTVAVARFILFAAIALHEYPETRQKIKNGDAGYLEAFVQEVRRFYPFFPFIGGIVRQAFTWRDCSFPVGARVMLDVYGTNHDARIWQDSDRFDPERFIGRNDSPYSFIPQGGGDYLTNHRCAGEALTIALMKRCIDLLVNGMQYEVVAENTEIDMRRMPALPKNPLFIRHVQPDMATRVAQKMRMKA